MTEKKDK